MISGGGQPVSDTRCGPVAVPVVILGTFGALGLFGYSINMLTMFARSCARRANQLRTDL